MRSKDYFAAIDLGSNSFHMLVVRMVAGGVQVVSKIKRKVRLAAGLRVVNPTQPDGNSHSEPHYVLEQDAKQRALDCLRVFADRVQDIDPSHIRCVGTATLRKVAHDSDFLAAAEEALGHPIEVISGDEEAATIYQGIARTTGYQDRLLVIDIGGASTELVLGEGFQAGPLRSLDMGCVTWLSDHFRDGQISSATVASAIDAARLQIAPVREIFRGHQGAMVLGASGTFKALEEIALARSLSTTFSPVWLQQLADEAIACGSLDTLHLKGLSAPRRHVFISGLCILIALCEELSLNTLQATNGALREGIIYGLLDRTQHAALASEADVQLRTLHTIAATYHLDVAQAERVLTLAEILWQQSAPSWKMPRNSYELMRAIAYLHELGLSLAYKGANAHATYMIQHLDMPGFSKPLKAQIISLLEGCAGIIDDDSSAAEHSQPAMRNLERIIRLAIILCQRRHGAQLDVYQLSVDGQCLELQATAGFFQQTPFLSSLLEAENERLRAPEHLTFSS